MHLSSSEKEFIREHENDDVRQLALRSGLLREMRTPFILDQIAGRQFSKSKIPTWFNSEDIIYPPHISMEQSSSEITAKYKSSLIKTSGGLFVDLTGGLGVDFSFIAQNFDKAIYVEQNKDLCAIAENNLKALHLENIKVINDKAENYINNISEAEFIFLDPSRRDNWGKKVFRIEDCDPDISEIKNKLLEKAPNVLIKYSPLLDITLAVSSLKAVAEVHILSVDNECKELLFLLKRDKQDCIYRAVNLKSNGINEILCFNKDEEQNASTYCTQELGKYLYEPNASILKAGAFNLVQQKYAVRKLHRNSHLYTSDYLLNDFPGRKFEIQSIIIPNKKGIRELLALTNKANVTVRNFPMSVSEIRKRTRLQDGGKHYLFATTLADESKVWIVCEKPEE